MPRRVYTPFERRLRMAARVALYSALAIAGLAAWPLARIASPPENRREAKLLSRLQNWSTIDYTQFPEVTLLQRYVQINTSYPAADELSGARFLAAELERAGIPAHIEVLEGKRANLWAFVEGDDPKAIVLHGHLDVEPASEQVGWRFPPYEAHIEGPWMLGRGIYDMKSLTIAELLALIDLKASGKHLKRSILFLQTSSEETGSDLGTRWILSEHPELVARMGTVLTEGGVVEAISPLAIKYWGIDFAQKRFGDLLFCASDRERLASLRALLKEFNSGDPAPALSPSVESFLKTYGPTRDLGLYKILLADPRDLLLRPDKFDQLTPILKALFRNEIQPLGIDEDPTGGYLLETKLHLLPEADQQTVLADLLPEWKRLGETWTYIPAPDGGRASPTDTPFFHTMEESVRAFYPDAPVGPYFSPWNATDARFFRDAGIPSYGFSPFLITASDTLEIGKANEKMPLPGYVDGVRILRDLLVRLER